ncbi:hypothetical protein SS50377_22771 [Spironucleus salmonicida]|uniref:Uncharacterized protein n=1 Tax=Spironucleus salmonicida TaxID=348837 RepID=A0A9P8S002_9EUKA|nr:hypothetical protein SS50377_22762 [Spironucleus salmonicida]KAH0575146.1 hypothetical protein SS50377_22771 [Spironucleus salmonicida]
MPFPTKYVPDHAVHFMQYRLRTGPARQQSLVQGFRSAQQQAAVTQFQRRVQHCTEPCRYTVPKGRDVIKAEDSEAFFFTHGGFSPPQARPTRFITGRQKAQFRQIGMDTILPCAPPEKDLRGISSCHLSVETLVAQITYIVSQRRQLERAEQELKTGRAVRERRSLMFRK